jgi:uncharacterized protein (TIGR02421 family)
MAASGSRALLRKIEPAAAQASTLDAKDVSDLPADNDAAGASQEPARDEPRPVREATKRATESRSARAPADTSRDVTSEGEGTYDVPSIPPAPAAGPWRSYKEMVALLATRIVDAQKPIRVLQSVRWPDQVADRFLKGRARELPELGDSYYQGVELGFDPARKSEEFEAIAQDVVRDLGDKDALGAILERTALEYRDVVRMLGARGTPLFYGYSRKLYGSPKDKFPDGKLSVRDLGHRLYGILSQSSERLASQIEARSIAAADAAAELNKRFSSYFGDDQVRVEVDDAIISDAAAGSDYVKVRSGAVFSPRDIDILEVHEGWVHVATSLNGQAQSVAKWLAKGPPRTTTVQEGLAALMEIFTFRTYPKRARRLNDRVIAVDKAEDGASFLDVFEWYRTEGYDEEECFANTRRIFRGGVLSGGAPFTKDACYCKGIVLNYAFIQSAIHHGRDDLIPLLFLGKVAHEDVPTLAARIADGVVRPPKYLPALFRDLSGLAIWMAYSSFLTQLHAESTADYYGRLFSQA